MQSRRNDDRENMMSGPRSNVYPSMVVDTAWPPAAEARSRINPSTSIARDIPLAPAPNIRRDSVSPMCDRPCSEQVSGRPTHSENPEAAASSWNICTVSSEYSVEVLVDQPELRQHVVGHA